MRLIFYILIVSWIYFMALASCCAQGFIVKKDSTITAPYDAYVQPIYAQAEENYLIEKQAELINNLRENLNNAHENCRAIKKASNKAIEQADITKSVYRRHQEATEETFQNAITVSQELVGDLNKMTDKRDKWRVVGLAGITYFVLNVGFSVLK